MQYSVEALFSREANRILKGGQPGFLMDCRRHFPDLPWANRIGSARPGELLSPGWGRSVSESVHAVSSLIQTWTLAVAII